MSNPDYKQHVGGNVMLCAEWHLGKQISMNDSYLHLMNSW